MKTTPRFLLGVLLGAAIGGGLVTAHFTGRLAPVYHKLGWHTLDASQERHANHDRGEHAGMPGMEMSGEGASAGGMAGMNMPGMSMPGMDHSQHKAAKQSVPGHVIVQLSEARQQLIGVKTGRVERDRLLMSIRAVGIIEPDQTRLARVQTRISGWVTKVFVNYVGQNVKRDDPLLEIYSPNLLSTQEEYLVALAQEPRAPGGGEPKLARIARRRLELLGVPEDEIEKLAKTKKPRDTLMLRAPINGVVLDRNVLEGNYVEPSSDLYRIADLSVVWLQAKIYEYELPHIELGQPVTATLLSDATAEFEGKVSFVEPIVQEKTRTIKVRVEIPNDDDRLKPGMYADLKIDHDMGEGLLVPDSAVVRTGERGVAFRALDGGWFEPVEVTIGGRFGQRIEVLSGLAESEKILISAVFLIDSESQMRASSGGGHHHH
ncbi:MAG TPA: efflux RND transporter periplasmic adaptor subunit [Pirellulales bacterium]|jgi:Cu(I)/Ag(I) efflux system membrane fusion protein|nr:efflux RND transporter periplasmic adaptor subunit [Pirellulales bacterium]